MGGVFPIFLLAAMAIAAAILVAFGWRGRQVDEHPHCRRCGFDLFGRPDGSAICSECGADVSRPRSVRSGRRAPRWRLLMVASPLLLICGGGAGVLGWGRARGVEWNRHVPAWWLSRAADGGDVAARDAALVELARRIEVGKLPTDREAALLDKALAYQADLDRPWAPGWGMLVEAAHQAGRLPNDQWEQYLLNAVTFRLVPERQIVRPCDELRFQVYREPDRSSRIKRLEFQVVGLYASSDLLISGHTATAHIPYPGTLDWHPEEEMPPIAGLMACALYFDASTATGRFPVLEADFSEDFRYLDPSELPADGAMWDPALARTLTPGPQTAVMTIIIRPLWLNQASPFGKVWRPKLDSPGDRRVRLQANWTLAPSPQSQP